MRPEKVRKGIRDDDRLAAAKCWGSLGLGGLEMARARGVAESSCQPLPPALTSNERADSAFDDAEMTPPTLRSRSTQMLTEYSLLFYTTLSVDILQEPRHQSSTAHGVSGASMPSEQCFVKNHNAVTWTP